MGLLYLNIFIDKFRYLYKMSFFSVLVDFFSVIKARILGRRKLSGAPSTECRVYKVKVLQDYKVYPDIIV